MHIHFCLHSDNVELASLVILPTLLPDPRSKLDIKKIVYIAKVRQRYLMKSVEVLTATVASRKSLIQTC